MDDKSPRERLFETLDAIAERVRQWPEWMRDAVSTEHIFRVAPAKPVAESDDERR